MTLARADPQLGVGQMLEEGRRVLRRDHAVGAALHQEDRRADGTQGEAPWRDVGDIVVRLYEALDRHDGEA